MIDPHVHLRDWNERHKETIRHGLSVAWRAGLDGVFEMPNTDPPLTSRGTILRRIEDADKAIDDLGVEIYHGVWAGLTADPAQVEDVMRTWVELRPRVVGLKMFAAHSTGGMGIAAVDGRRAVIAQLAELGYDGVLGVHCEKAEMLADSWDDRRPSSWAEARPAEAETASVVEQISLVRETGFAGTLHVVHVSVPAALEAIEAARKSGLRVTCALTPQHALLSASDMDGKDGALLKENPPLRPDPMPARMLEALLEGRIDWVESDHAPHTLDEKRTRNPSGVPALPFWPRFVEMLAQRGIRRSNLERVTHEAICERFEVAIEASGREPEDPSVLAREYPFDPFARLRGAA